MFNSEAAQKKWAPLLDHSDVAPITDSYRRAVTATLLENTEKALKEQAAHARGQLHENNTVAGNVQNFDPTLIALIRRAMPSLIAYDVCGVQPMSGPTGLIFAMVAKETSKASGKGVTRDANYTSFGSASPNTIDTAFAGASPGTGYERSVAETLTDDASVTDSRDISTMGFEIKKQTVTAKSRALKAGYTMELAQDLKAIHGLDAEAELANILSTEILAEINREVIAAIATDAKAGANYSGTSSANNLGARWGQEKFQALVYRLEQEANAIAQESRRGKGNFVIVSPDVGSALAASGNLNYADSVASTGLTIDSTGNTFAGTLNGAIKVYVDPYATAAKNVIVGYRGSNPFDAGLFYCPYVPLTMVKAVGEDDFQPRIAFKTRYGLASNPDAAGVLTPLEGTTERVSAGANAYYRSLAVTNL